MEPYSLLYQQLSELLNLSQNGRNTDLWKFFYREFIFKNIFIDLLILSLWSITLSSIYEIFIF